MCARWHICLQRAGWYFVTKERHPCASACIMYFKYIICFSNNIIARARDAERIAKAIIPSYNIYRDI